MYVVPTQRLVLTEAKLCFRLWVVTQAISEMADVTVDNPWLYHPELGEVARKHVVPEEHCYDGVWYPRAFPVSSLERTKTFQFREDDVVMVAYPKSGMFHAWWRHQMETIAALLALC